MKNMIKSGALFVLVLLLIFSFSSFVFGGTYRLAFLEAEEVVPVEDESEYNWAKENEVTTLIFPSGAGKFKNEKGNAVKLSDFQIVWWHRANSADIPAVFLDSATKNAFMDFVEAGGSLFLSQVALHYVYDLGLESVVPRLCQPNVDHAVSGIIAAPGMEKHALFAGFDKMGEDPTKGISIDCYGHDCMSDFIRTDPLREAL